MAITIDLPPKQEAKLQALADARGTNAQTILMELIEALPDNAVPAGNNASPTTANETPRRKTTADILAGWDAEGLPSVYGRDPADATVIARRLRKQAESRELLK